MDDCGIVKGPLAQYTAEDLDAAVAVILTAAQVDAPTEI